MPERTIQPSALPAEYAERVSDRAEDPTPLRKPSRGELQQSVYKLRGELDAYVLGIQDVLAILKADNDEAGRK